MGNNSLKVDDTDKGIPVDQKKGSGCVKSETYQGAATKYE